MIVVEEMHYADDDGGAAVAAVDVFYIAWLPKVSSAMTSSEVDVRASVAAAESCTDTRRQRRRTCDNEFLLFFPPTLRLLHTRRCRCH